ncbi:MAG: hypothetical protein JOY59_06265, partial [Candidatus Eremiobacteraeota bacterium]|nr:hypothetical protein [Candidatus Eremiobacteraeota bacterium]
TFCSMVSGTSDFIGQDFGATPQQIRRLVLTGTGSFGFNANLQYSDDNATWTRTAVAVNVPAGSTAPVQVAVDAYGAHRYWRLWDLDGNSYLQIATVQMMSCN